MNDTLIKHLEAIRDEVAQLPAPRLVTPDTVTAYDHALAALEIAKRLAPTRNMWRCEFGDGTGVVYHEHAIPEDEVRPIRVLGRWVEESFFPVSETLD